MKELIEVLHTGNYSCVIRSSNETHTFSQRGVADLYDIVKNRPGFLEGSLVADKVVGKAAAALMILGGIAELYAEVISSSALALLRDADIAVGFGREVPFIENRDKSNWCPLEKMCYNETSAKTILPLVEEFIGSLQERQKG